MLQRIRSRDDRSIVRRLLTTLGVLAVVAGAAVAAHEPVRDVGPDDIALASAGGCTLRDGPGQFQQNCIQVRGEGLLVESVQSYVQAVYVGGYPVTVCTISVEITGTLADGSPYRVSGTTEPGCSPLSRGMTATPNREFLPQSQLCARTAWGAYGWSPPACVQVRPS